MNEEGTRIWEQYQRSISSLREQLDVLRWTEKHSHPNIYEIDESIEIARKRYRNAMRRARSRKNNTEEFRLYLSIVKNLYLELKKLRKLMCDSFPSIPQNICG